MSLILSIAVFLFIVAVLWVSLDRVVPRLWVRTELGLRRVSRLILRQKHVTRLVEVGTTRWQPRLKRYHPYRIAALICVIGLFGAVFVGNAFLELAEMLQAQSDSLKDTDQLAHRAAGRLRREGPTQLFTFFTLIGTPVGLGIIAIAGAVVLLLTGKKYRAGYLFFTCIGGWIMNWQLKVYFARARPDLNLALRKAHGYSFPSGHAMMSMVVIGALCYLVMRTSHSWRIRSAVFALGASTILCISISRVYLGVHWISDIGAGLAAGFVWLVSATVAYETFRRILALRRGQQEATAASAEPGQPV